MVCGTKRRKVHQKTQEKERVPQAALTELKQAFPERWDPDEQGFIFLFVCLGKAGGWYIPGVQHWSWPMVGAQVSICEMNE